MGTADDRSEENPQTRCQNLVWEASRRDGSPVPGRYCVNRLGIVHVLDCPVFQASECCLFEYRDEKETPLPLTEDQLDHLRTKLSRDYLRWPYWKRVELLRGPEAPSDEVEDLPDVIEAEPEADEEEEPVLVSRAPVSPVLEKAPRERYPGERRSEEDGRSSPVPSTEDAPPVTIDEVFSAGIFPAEEEPVAGAPEGGKATPETPEKPKTEPEREKQQGKRSRRGRRSRRRRRRRKPPSRDAGSGG